MNTKIYLKILAAVLFVAIALLVMYTMDAAFWISGHLVSAKAPVSSLETIHAANYDFRKTPPRALGEIKKHRNIFIRLKLRKPEAEYVRLKLRFRAESTEGNPNVFQTAPLNGGMRMELSGSTAAIIVPDPAATGGLKGLTLTTALKTGQWYELDVEALNHAFVRATLDGFPVANYVAPSLSMETSQLLVGGGFDPSRTFRGRIHDIFVTKGRLPESSFAKLSIENPESIHAFRYIYGLVDKSVKTVHVAKYDSQYSPPIVFGEIENSDTAYIRLKLHFRAESTEGYPNVFQTAPLNRGMRMELSGSTAAIIVPDPAAPGGFKGLTLTTTLKTGQWYELDVEALNHAFVRATLDGLPVANYACPSLSMETSRLLVGGGFDTSRTFRGQFKNVSFIKGNYSIPLSFGKIKNSDNAYVRLKFRFRADSTEDHPNLFQTAPVNRGMRMEITGSTASIVVADLAEKNKIRGLTLTNALKTGQWYTLEVEALNGAFLRASLDGHPVANYAGASLSMETSDLLVGGGFDSSRAFRGRIENISLIKGNLPHLPHRSLSVVYVVLVSLVILFLGALWKALGEYPGVQRVIGKLALLAIPLIVILGYYEYRLSFITTNYYAKRVALEQQLDKIEVLAQGSSNTLYGIRPDAFSQKGFNLAFPGNAMYFDAKLAEKFVQKMPHLRTIVLTVNYFTLGADHAVSAQPWRQFFLRQYFGVTTELAAHQWLDWGFWLNPNNFSRIALYGNEAKTYINSDFLAPVDIIVSSSGWFDGGDVPGDASNTFGAVAAEGHNAGTDTKNYDRNLGYWETLIPFLQQRNIAVVMVLLPTDVSYYRHLDKTKTELMDRKLKEFTVRHHIRFVNYTGDPRFTLNDFTWEMPDHLNAQGAMKFSRILDDECIKAPEKL